MFVFLFGIYVGQEYKLPSVKDASNTVIHYLMHLQDQPNQQDQQDQPNPKMGNPYFYALIKPFLKENQSPEKNE